MPTLIIDRADALDWVRTKDGGERYKAKDTSLVPSSMVKFSLKDVPSGIRNQVPTLYFYIEKSYAPGIMVEVYAISKSGPDDNWSFEQNLSRDLHNWPTEIGYRLGVYDSSQVGWKTFTIPTFIWDEVVAKGSITIKWQLASGQGGISSRIASPLSLEYGFAPYIRLTFTNGSTLPELAVHRSDIAFNTINPVPGSQITISATVHNNGTPSLSGAIVEFWDGSPYDAGTLIGTVTTGNIPGGGGTTTVSVNYLTSLGRHIIYVRVKTPAVVYELHHTNNLAFRTLWVLNDYSTFLSDFDTVENSEAEWIADYDTLIRPSAPNMSPHRPQHPIFAGIHMSGEAAHSGTWSVKLILDSLHDDGTLWIVRPIPLHVPPGSTKTVKVEFWALKSTGAFPNTAIAAIDPSPPEIEEDFSDVGSTNEIWSLHTYSRIFTAPAGLPLDIEVFVAVGINNTQTNPIDQAHWIDDILISVS